MSLLSIDQSITHALFLGASANHILLDIIFIIASGFIYTLPVLLLYLFWKGGQDRINSAKIFLAAIIAWFVLSKLVGSYLFSHYGFRDRPFTDFGIKEFFFERPDKAFPSDHSAVILAAAIGLFAYRYQKISWFFLMGGIISSICRVILGFHWAGDILGGWLIGAIAMGLVYLFDGPLNRFFDKMFNIVSFKRNDAANQSPQLPGDSS